MTTAILDRRPASTRTAARCEIAADDLVRLFALDRIGATRRRLVCHWYRSDDGTLVCSWEHDLPLHRACQDAPPAPAARAHGDPRHVVTGEQP
jgi:hypothetical protein